MTRTRGLVVLLTIVLSLSAELSRHPASGQSPVVLAALQHPDDAHLRLQWLGVSTWIMSRGKDVVVVDPFFTRPPMWQIAGSIFGAAFQPDVARIKAVLPTLPETTRFLLIGHAHYDHLMDVGYYLRTAPTQPLYVGSRTAHNILRGWAPPKLDFVIADDPARLGRPIRAGQVVVTPFLSSHAPHLAGLTLMDGEVSEPRTSPPSDAWDYKLGQTLMFVIDFLGEQDQVVTRLFINGAASDPGVMAAIPEAFLSRHPIDVAILCVPGWDKVADYPMSVLDRLQPKQVILSHYDDFFQPYVNGEDPHHGMRIVPFAHYEGFVEHLTAYYRRRSTAPPVIEPKTGDIVCVDC